MYNIAVLSLQAFFAAVMYFMIEKHNKKGIKKAFVPNKTLCMALLGIIAVFAAAIRMYSGHNSGGDYNEYVAQARSIVEGTMNEQVAANTFIVTNSHFQFGPYAYPWGYSLLLAPVYRLFGMNYLALKSVNLVFFVLMILLLYYVYSQNLNRVSAFAAAAFIIFVPVNLRLTDNVLSDMSFCFFSVFSVFATDKLYKSGKKQTLWAVIAGVTSFCAFFIRTAGIVSLLTLLAADVFYVSGKVIKPLGSITKRVFDEKQKLITHSIPYLIFAAGFIIIKMIFPASDSGYGNYLENLSVSSVISNISQYVKSFSELFDAGTYLSGFLFVVTLVFALFGLAKNLFNRLIYAVYSVGMFALIMLFPEYQGIRYLISIIPWIIMFAFLTMEFIADKVKDKKFNNYINLKSAFSAVICVALFSSLLISGEYFLRRIKYSDSMSTNAAYTEDALDMYAYIKENTDSDDVIVYGNPRQIWLNTKRKSFSVEENNADNLKKADYILIGKSDEGFLADKIKSEDGIKNIYSNDRFVFYVIE